MAMWSTTRAGAAGLAPAALAMMMNWCISPRGASAFSGAPAAFAGGMSTGAMLTLRGAPGPRPMCARRARVGMQADSSGAEAYHARHWKESSSDPVVLAAATAAISAQVASTPAPGPEGAAKTTADAGMAAGQQVTPAGANKYRDFEENWVPPTPSPDVDAEEVVKQLLMALKNNNKPKANAGLRTVLAFSSPSNPITQREPEFFFGMMQNSQYSLLLGKFETFRIVATEDLSNTGAGYGAETVAVQLELAAPTQTMMDAGVDFSFMDSSGAKGQSTVSLKWQLSKNEDTGCWLSDTLFFVPVQKKNMSMKELTTSEEAKDSARFKGTPASQKLKAQALKPPPKKMEPSAFAVKAASLNLLKPTSPLLTTGMVGNKGFDPAGFASSPDLLLQYREAELKHSR